MGIKQTIVKILGYEQLNAIIKKDSIWLKPVPTKNVKDGIRIVVPKLKGETMTGILFGDIVKDQMEYFLPDGVTADDVTDIELGAQRDEL